jgi:hypothetical protein
MAASLADAMRKTKKILYLHERRETWRVRIDGKAHGAESTDCREEAHRSTAATEGSRSSEDDVFRLADRQFEDSESREILICIRSFTEEGGKKKGDEYNTVSEEIQNE